MVDYLQKEIKSIVMLVQEPIEIEKNLISFDLKICTKIDHEELLKNINAYQSVNFKFPIYEYRLVAHIG